jgi:hypothetical protein
MHGFLLIGYTKNKIKFTYGYFPLEGMVYLAILRYIMYVNNMEPYSKKTCGTIWQILQNWSGKAW